MHEKNPLVGKTIAALQIASDRKALRFTLTDATLIVRVYVDCCSETWIEHVDLPALGFPALVSSVEDLELNKPPEEREAFEVIKFYGCKIVTDHGEIIIDYRNESNGYYGGCLSWPDDCFYGGVFNQNVSECNWQSI